MAIKNITHASTTTEEMSPENHIDKTAIVAGFRNYFNRFLIKKESGLQENFKVRKQSNRLDLWRQDNPEACNVARSKGQYTLTPKIRYMQNIHVFSSILEFIKEGNELLIFYWYGNEA